MKPDARVKWLARAVQQAHPQASLASVSRCLKFMLSLVLCIPESQDGRLAPKTIYDIIAHAKFANDVSEKAGQRMY